MRTGPRPIYEFGPYRLDPTERRLTRNGREVTLRPKLFDLLVVLVEHHQQVVDKDKLFKLVWGDTAVEDNNLTVSINALRHKLGDENYIETVARRQRRRTPDASKARTSLPHIAGDGEQQGRGEELEAGPVQQLPKRQIATHAAAARTSTDRPAHERGFRRNRPRASHKPAAMSSTGAAQSGQVSGSTGGL